MPSFIDFIQYIHLITNSIDNNFCDKYEYYFNYLYSNEFNTDFEERVARQIGGEIINFNYSYYKPIKYNDFYIILDWSLYKNNNDYYIGDIIIKGYKNLDDFTQTLIIE